MTARLSVLFIAFTVAALFALFPLRLALSLIGASEHLFTARAAQGTIWNGVLRDISIDSVSLGDFSAQISPVALLRGAVAIDLRYLIAPQTRGTIVARFADTGVENVSATLALPGAFKPLPVETIELRDASVRFSGNRCVSAGGQVRLQLNGNIGNFALGQVLIGTPRCDRDVLSIALASASAMERITMRLVPDGQYTATVIIKPADAAAASALENAGFRDNAAGRTLQISGKF